MLRLDARNPNKLVIPAIFNISFPQLRRINFILFECNGRRNKFFDDLAFLIDCFVSSPENGEGIYRTFNKELVLGKSVRFV